jgi:hypothetical protein
MKTASSKRKLSLRSWSTIASAAGVVVLVGLVGSTAPAAGRVAIDTDVSTLPLANAEATSRFAAMVTGELICPPPILAFEGNISSGSSLAMRISDQVFDLDR